MYYMYGSKQYAIILTKDYYTYTDIHILKMLSIIIQNYVRTKQIIFNS